MPMHDMRDSSLSCLVSEEPERGPLITHTDCIASTASIASTAAFARGPSHVSSLSRDASLVRAVSGTLEELLAIGAQTCAVSWGAEGREAGAYVAHKTPMRTRPNKSNPLKRPTSPEFSWVPSHGSFTRAQSAAHVEGPLHGHFTRTQSDAMRSFEGHLKNLLFVTGPGTK